MAVAWPPPPPTQSTRPDPEPRPRLTALRAVFNWAYVTRPAWVWDLPPRQQSDEILRAVCRVCRSYQMPCRGLDWMALDPKLHHAELMTIAALGAVDEEDLIATINADTPDHPFPAGDFDPDGRTGRPPGAVVLLMQRARPDAKEAEPPVQALSGPATVHPVEEEWLRSLVDISER